jgi:hypothetical protein
MIRKSHDYDYLGAFFFLLFRFLFHFEGGVQQEDTTDLLFYYLFIFWAAKEYGRTSYAQSIRLCRSMPFFFTREKETSGTDIQASKDGTSLVKGIIFFLNLVFHTRSDFLYYLFFVQSFFLYSKDRTGNEGFT